MKFIARCGILILGDGFMKLILGSQSPRRKEILEMAGYTFEVRVSHVDENVVSIFPEDKVKNIAKKKCEALFSNCGDDEVILCADTIVVIDHAILEKPKDKEDARKMIETLQGRTHTVYTAVYIKSKEREENFLESTLVSVLPMSSKEIENYISTEEPYDKAGAYAIQGIFSKYISKIQGDYYNVMGLPIAKVHQTLKKFFGEEDITPFNLQIKSYPVICKKCGKENNSTSRFCMYCGDSLSLQKVKDGTTVICPVCGKEQTLTDEYCSSCGFNLKDGFQPEAKNQVRDGSKDRLSLVSMILGIASILVNFMIMFSGIFLGIVAIVLAVISMRKGDKVKSTIGLITGILGTFLTGFLLYILFLLFSL